MWVYGTREDDVISKVEEINREGPENWLRQDDLVNQVEAYCTGGVHA